MPVKSQSVAVSVAANVATSKAAPILAQDSLSETRNQTAAPPTPKNEAQCPESTELGCASDKDQVSQVDAAASSIQTAFGVVQIVHVSK